MNKNKIVALVCGMALVASLALVGCSQSQPYTPQAKSPEVSSPTIAKEGVLRVGVNTSNPPLAGQSTSIIGIDVDIAAALADELGLKVEIVDVKADPIAALTNGTVDVCLGVDSASASAAAWSSDIYLPTAVALFSTNATTGVPSAGSAVTIGAQISSLSAWSVTNEFGANVLKAETDLPSAFQDLSTGAINYVASDAIIGMYSAHSAGYSVYISALMQQPAGYVAQVASTNTSLQSAITNKLNTLNQSGIIKLIEKKWLGTSLDLTSVALTPGATAATTATQDAAAAQSSTPLSEGTIADNAVQATEQQTP
ncbi:MAG: transporter substrate-binding domain-containing protein [Coriobacteriia bacterium]|nr:transporter substrate-binding domain-containing protein [Coriobacteriia bacterium]